MLRTYCPLCCQPNSFNGEQRDFSIDPDQHYPCCEKLRLCMASKTTITIGGVLTGMGTVLVFSGSIAHVLGLSIGGGITTAVGCFMVIGGFIAGNCCRSENKDSTISEETALKTVQVKQ